MAISNRAKINELRAAAVAGVIADAQAKRKANEAAFVFDPRKTDGSSSAKLSTDQYKRLMSRNGEWVSDQELVQIAKADGASLYFTVIQAGGTALTYQAHDAAPASNNSNFYHIVVKGGHYEPFGGYAKSDGNCGLWSIKQERERVDARSLTNHVHKRLAPAYKNEKELQAHVKAQFPDVLRKLTAKPVAKEVKAVAPVVTEVKAEAPVFQEVKVAAPIAQEVKAVNAAKPVVQEVKAVNAAKPVVQEVKAVKNKPAIIAGTVTGANATYSLANNKNTLFNYQQIDNARAEQAHAVLQQHDLGTLRELLQQAEKNSGEHLTWKIAHLGKQYSAQFGENFFRRFVEGKVSENDLPAGVFKSIENSLKHDCVSALTSEAYRNDAFRDASSKFDVFLGVDRLPVAAAPSRHAI